MKKFTPIINFSICFILVLTIIYFFCAEPDSITVYRDIWGVPHIYAVSEETAAFAFGYTQAQDRIEQLMFAFRYAEGSLAEVFGTNYIEKDFEQKTWRHAQISQTHYAELPPKIRKICEAFVKGIETYCASHPQKVPAWAPKIQPWHIIALTRTFIWWWPLDQAFDDLHRSPAEKPHTHGSNQWVVSGRRTATGAPIALIDPHLNFEGEGHWIEARLHGGDLNVCGMAVVGTPFIALGHNEHLSWAATTGGPDCGDVYELELNSANPMQYRYDNQWRDLAVDTLKIKIKTDTGIREERRFVIWSHHGPIVKTEGDRAFAIKLPYFNEFKLICQIYQMNTAKDLDDFKAALAMDQFMPQNIMYADVDNNIYYCRTGRVPIRPGDFNWSRPVPGNTSKTEWLGIHSQKDLVQLQNPAGGFMQNCNISPGTMLPESPLTPAKYLNYIYNASASQTNPRGRSALRLLSPENKLTLARAQEIALDTHVDGYEIWQTILHRTYEELKPKYRDLEEPVKLILNWNGQADQQNEAAALFRYWREHCQKLYVAEVRNAADLPELQKKLLLIALQQAKAELVRYFGHFQVSWGETVRISRGNTTWPVSGGSFGAGVSTLRAAWGKTSPGDGISYVTGGQSCCMLVSLKKPVTSFSILPFGQSDDPTSPHFSDQAEKLFSASRFKSTFFRKKELLQNISDQIRLKFPD
jgi:acyl-homoserine lactone acylase PvdQ